MVRVAFKYTTLAFAFFFVTTAFAQSNEAQLKNPATLLGPAPPYAPRNSEYSLELGLANSTYELLWLGGTVGTHLGSCLFVETDTCQQFLDGHLGFKVREAETHFDSFASLRWQYVNFPDRHSVFWRIFGGAAHIRNASSRDWRPLVGGGIGVTTYLHERFDLRLEVRGGFTERYFVDGLIGLEVKTDRFLSVFAKRLRDFGFETVETAIEATSTTLEATGEGLGEIVEGVSAPFKNKKKKQDPSGKKNKENSAPAP